MNSNRIAPKLAIVSLSMLAFMTTFEYLKQLAFPSIKLWESHVMTILVSTAVASLSSYLVLRAFKRLNTELASKKRESDGLHAELRQKLSELEGAQAKVKTLSGLLPICASCKKIRDERGEWKQIEEYISDRSDADFSHGLCPDCAMRLYPDLFETSKK